jgi:hypothetical protein
MWFTPPAPLIETRFEARQVVARSHDRATAPPEQEGRLFPLSGKRRDILHEWSPCSEEGRAVSASVKNPCADTRPTSKVSGPCKARRNQRHSELEKASPNLLIGSRRSKQ